ALLIGINEYPELDDAKKLYGSVADVDLIRQFLVTKLRVPEAHISTLLNKDATHDHIISSIMDLALDSTIEKDDPILIFYAGHGGTLPKPPRWNANSSEIQCLVAYDAGYNDVKGMWVKGVVPDVVLTSLLDTLSKVKGNNITVILDCCHSGSGTR
ncbi:peptidase C14, caspase domain-containing protein, partial [Vararia minispora EC-137]